MSERTAIKGMQTVLQAIKHNGNSAAVTDQMVSFKEREKIVETEKYFSLT